MPTATYHFKREPDSVNGFLSGQRASTDAIGAVHSWSTMAEGRSHEVVEDEDDFIIATLTWDVADTNAAGLDLDTLCDAVGIRRDVVEWPAANPAR